MVAPPPHSPTAGANTVTDHHLGSRSTTVNSVLSLFVGYLVNPHGVRPVTWLDAAGGYAEYPVPEIRTKVSNWARGLVSYMCSLHQGDRLPEFHVPSAPDWPRVRPPPRSSGRLPETSPAGLMLGRGCIDAGHCSRHARPKVTVRLAKSTAMTRHPTSLHALACTCGPLISFAHHARCR